VHFLSLAASNSAEVEKLALGAGMKKGGAAKGELVLAMYELANCFRNGWGIKKDPAAAKQYYETAANLGDTDAMNEVAWCYTEGFGTKKDKVRQPASALVAFLRRRHSRLVYLPILAGRCKRRRRER
jgi:TPR repeat protein